MVRKATFSCPSHPPLRNPSNQSMHHMKLDAFHLFYKISIIACLGPTTQQTNESNFWLGSISFPLEILKPRKYIFLGEKKSYRRQIICHKSEKGIVNKIACWWGGEKMHAWLCQGLCRRGLFGSGEWLDWPESVLLCMELPVGWPDLGCY